MMINEYLKGKELTCDEIWYKYKMGEIEKFTVMRLTLERLAYLEDYIERLKEANQWKS